MNKPPDHKLEQWIEQHGETPPVDLSVVVPAFNEQWRLPTSLIDVIDYLDAHHPRYELIVVDDGSNDATSDVVQKFARIRSQVRLIRSPRNQGKGHAVRLGVLSARGTRVLFTDADGSTPIAELDRLWKALDGGADVAIGSRAIFAKDTAVKTVWYRKVMGRVFNFFVNTLLLPQYSDTQCGFKLFTAESAAHLFKLQRSDRWAFDVELLFLADRLGFKVAEVPVNWENAPGSKVNLVTDSLAMFRDLFLFRIWHRGVTPELRRRVHASSETPGV